MNISLVLRDFVPRTVLTVTIVLKRSPPSGVDNNTNFVKVNTQVKNFECVSTLAINQSENFWFSFCEKDFIPSRQSGINEIITFSLCPPLWQYGLWSFQTGVQN